MAFRLLFLIAFVAAHVYSFTSSRIKNTGIRSSKHLTALSYKASAQRALRQQILGGEDIINVEPNKKGKNAGGEDEDESPQRSRMTKQKQKALENQILKYSRRRNKWDIALKCFIQLRQQEGFLPRRPVYLAALNAAARGGLWETARAVLQDYEARGGGGGGGGGGEGGGPASDRMLQAAMKACTRGGRPDAAVALLLRALEGGPRGREEVGALPVATAMAALARMAEWDSVRRLGAYLERRGEAAAAATGSEAEGAPAPPPPPLPLAARNALIAASVAGYGEDPLGPLRQLLRLGEEEEQQRRAAAAGAEGPGRRRRRGQRGGGGGGGGGGGRRGGGGGGGGGAVNPEALSRWQKIVPEPKITPSIAEESTTLQTSSGNNSGGNHNANKKDSGKHL